MWLCHHDAPMMTSSKRNISALFALCEGNPPVDSPHKGLWRRTCCQYTEKYSHYIDVIMTTMASQITSLMVVYSTVYSDADQRIHQSSASQAFVWGIHRDRWIPRTKGLLRGKCHHLMTPSCNFLSIHLYASDRCKQSSANSFLLRIDSLLPSICDTVQLVPIRFWRVGQGQVGRTLGTTLGDGRCLWDSEARVRNWAPTREAISS